MLQLAPRLLYYAYLDRLDRSKFNRVFYKNYSGTQLKTLEDWGELIVERFWARRLFLEATNQIKYHQDKGHKVYIITGALDIMVSPLADHLGIDGWVATSPKVVYGQLTGELLEEPISGTRKRDAIIRIANDQKIDLSESFAYGDSQADLDLLAAVKRPVGVNPDRRLRDFANQHDWPTVIWRTKHLT